jgi:dTMP kinase
VNRGRLLAFEGLDGCGKTTQLARLARALRRAGHDVVETAEPTDGASGRRIREMARSGASVPAEQELRWFVEDRREHVREVVAPALRAGRLVLSDRYFLSTVAYQGALGLDWRAILADSEAEFPRPDLVLLLEVGVDAALARVRSRGGRRESVFEQRRRLERVAEIFAAVERDYVERIAGEAEPDEVERRVRERVEARLGLSLPPARPAADG